MYCLLWSKTQFRKGKFAVLFEEDGPLKAMQWATDLEVENEDYDDDDRCNISNYKVATT